MSVSQNRLRPALFLDRDGVLNVEAGFVHRPEDCILVEGAASLVRTANRLGYMTVVVTNQSGIGRGMYTEDDFYLVMEHLSRLLGAQEAVLDAIYFSPYHPEHGIGPYKQESDCRKPKPGMLLLAAEQYGLDLRRSALVGDRCSDLMAGAAANVGSLFLFGNGDMGACSVPFPYTQVQTLLSVERALVATSCLQSG